jgi:hypothetical protein
VSGALWLESKMTKTIIEQAVERVVDDLCKNNKEYYVFLHETAHALYRGDAYPESYVDCIVQKSFRDPAYTMYDAYCFLQANFLIQTGKISIFQVPIERVPNGDKDVIGNQEALDNLLHPFSGKFINNHSGDDGCLSWSKAINSLLIVRDEGKRFFALVPPTDYCSLEVGTNSAEKMLFYLRRAGSRGVARWPYHQNCITVFNRKFFGIGGKVFDQLLENVWGDFHSLPWAHEMWDKEARNQGIEF